MQRVGGFVAKYMGDGVLVFFGYPQAHEDDAERAVRGGLALIEAVGKLDSAEPRQGRPSILGVGLSLASAASIRGLPTRGRYHAASMRSSSMQASRL